MTYDPMRDLDEERDAYYPFQKGYVARGPSAPYVIGVLALAILAVLGLNIAVVNDASLLGLGGTQVTSDSRSVASTHGSNVN